MTGSTSGRTTRRALWWAERSRDEAIRANKQHGIPVKIETPAVVGAIIYLGECFNLSFDSNQRLIADVHAQIEARYRRNKWKLPANDFFYRNLDCLVINETCRVLARANGQRVDTVRGVAVGCIDSDPSKGPSPAYAGSLLLAETYKVVCVRTRKVIVDYFAVEFDD